jgi:hypothetical protein
MNLANFYDYVPMRIFTWHGDIAHILQGLNISPWWIYSIFGYLVIFLIWQFFTRTLILAYVYLNLNTTMLRASLMLICVLVFFGYFSMAGFFDYGDISNFLTGTAYLMIPGFIICVWPTRAWVLREVEKYSKTNV